MYAGEVNIAVNTGGTEDTIRVTVREPVVFSEISESTSGDCQLVPHGASAVQLIEQRRAAPQPNGLSQESQEKQRCDEGQSPENEHA